MANEQGPSSGVTPHLTIREHRAAEAIDFYVKAFGAAEHVRMPAGATDDRIMHAHLMINGGSLMVMDEFPEHNGGAQAQPAAGVLMHLQVDNANRWFDRAVAAGATVRMAPDDMFWGDRYGQVVDPFGHSWSIASPIAIS